MDETLSAAPRNVAETGFELGDYLAIVFDARWLILAVVAAVVGVAGAYTWLSAPVYRADALLQVSTPLSLPDVMRGEAEQPLPQDSPLVDEKTVVASRAVLGGVVDEFALETIATPRYWPLVGAAIARRRGQQGGLAAPLWGLGRYAWGGEQIAVTLLELPQRLLGKPLTLVAEAGDGYRLLDPDGRLLLTGRVGQVVDAALGGPHAVRLRVAHLRAYPGTHFQLVKRSRSAAVRALQGALAAEDGGKRSSILKISLDGADPGEAATILNAIADQYVAKSITQQSRQAARALHFLESQLPTLRERLQAAEAALHAYRKHQHSVDLSQEARSLIEQAAKAESELTALEQTWEELRRRFKPSHPKMVSLDAQITRMRGVREDLEQRMRALPDTEQTYMRLAREVEVATALYTSLLNSAQQQRVAMASTLANVRILDRAVPPEYAIWPRTGLIMALAMLFGGFLSLALVFTRHILQQGVGDAKTLESRFRLPVYAVIPHSKNQDRLQRPRARKRPHSLLVALQPADQSIESLRALRMSFLPARSANAPSFLPTQGSRAAVVVISSPVPGAGKSFVSANFAALLASTGERVLLIDGDLRKGQLDAVFGVAHYPGLSELPRGNADDLIYPTSVPGLDLLPSGRGTSDSVDRLLGEQLGQSLGQLRQIYNHIIIDTPPVLSVADAVVVARHATAAILVVKAGRVTLREVEHSLQRLRRAGIEPKGLLLNDVDPNSRRYGYGYAACG